MNMTPKKAKAARQRGRFRWVALSAAAWMLLRPGAAQNITVEIKEPEGVQEAGECVKCHQKVTPNLVVEFLNSTMGRAGIQNPGIYEEVKKQRAPKEKTEKRPAFLVKNGKITCVLCHGDNHTTITQTRGRVANAVCGGCHDSVDQEYEKGGGHSFDPPEETWKRSLGVSAFLSVPMPVLQLSRDVVYAQQGATAPPYFDPDPEFENTGRMHRNGCISCHTRHSFDVAEARKPESCQTCHKGAGIPVFDLYMESKHGSIYKTQGSGWNWSSRMPDAFSKGGYGAATCAVCHMLQAERYGPVKTTHKMTTKSIWNRGLQAVQASGEQATEAGYKTFFEQARKQAAAQRQAMTLVCRHCHSEKFAGDYLNAADEVKLSADLLVLRARSVLDGLARDGLAPLSSAALAERYKTAMPPAATETATAGATATAPKPLPALSPIERAFVDMAFDENVRTWLAAFHESPGGVYWQGYARLQTSLTRIQEMERAMRVGAAKSPAPRTR
jgi:hydroxylamine dehydrogenase